MTMDPIQVAREFVRVLPGLDLSQSDLARLEQLLALKQGKGWGAASIAEEVKCCLAVLGHAPAVVVDIGANQGLYTQQLLARFPAASYVLFEPCQRNIEILRQRFADSPAVVMHQLALSNSSGEATLFSNQSGSGLASLTKRNLAHFGLSMDVEEAVRVMRFDAFWRDAGHALTPIDYVKIDIEGHELDALEGMGDVLAEMKIIQFEFGGCNIDTRTFFRDFWHFFSARNFRLYRITPRGPALLGAYREADEFFATTNYIAANNALVPGSA